MSQVYHSRREDIDCLLAVVYDFAGDAEGILSFLRHIDFDLSAINDARELITAIPAHYRIKPGVYNVARLERDLVSWGPVAEGIRQVEENALNGSQAGL